jgi:hypothetical protein
LRGITSWHSPEVCRNLITLNRRLNRPTASAPTVPILLHVYFKYDRHLLTCRCRLAQGNRRPACPVRPIACNGDEGVAVRHLSLFFGLFKLPSSVLCSFSVLSLPAPFEATRLTGLRQRRSLYRGHLLLRRLGSYRPLPTGSSPSSPSSMYTNCLTMYIITARVFSR